MSNITYIYQNKEGKINLLDSLNYTLEEFKQNPVGCYPNWDNRTMTASEIKFEYPCFDSESQEIREMTRQEKILQLGMNELLQDGEYIEENKIKTIKKPENLLKAVWNKEEHTWSEGMTAEELTKLRSDKILEYSKLEADKKALQDSKFNSDDEIALIDEKLSELEADINNLALKISALKV